MKKKIVTYIPLLSLLALLLVSCSWDPPRPTGVWRCDEPYIEFDFSTEVILQERLGYLGEGEVDGEIVSLFLYWSHGYRLLVYEESYALEHDFDSEGKLLSGTYKNKGEDIIFNIEHPKKESLTFYKVSD